MFELAIWLEVILLGVGVTTLVTLTADEDNSKLIAFIQQTIIFTSRVVVLGGILGVTVRLSELPLVENVLIFVLAYVFMVAGLVMTVSPNRLHTILRTR